MSTYFYPVKMLYMHLMWLLLQLVEFEVSAVNLFMFELKHE